MNGTYKPGGNMNLSGTQGLGLDMEPWAYEARGRNSGLRQGRREGYDEGLSKGRSKGFGDGFLRGVQAGREQAWDEANEIIEKLNTDFSAERDDYNRSAVVINALRMTIETLIRENPKAVSHIHGVFFHNYKKEVNESIREGWIKMAPHVDPSFIESSPKMQAFIMSVL